MHLGLSIYREAICTEDNIVAILATQNSGQYRALLEGTSPICIIIVNRPEPQWETNYVYVEEHYIVEHRISQWQVEQWAFQGTEEQMISYFRQAEIIYDPIGYMTRMRERLLRLSSHLKKLRICEAYSCFLRNYIEAKELLVQNQRLDAYYAILNSLHGWAKLAIYEAGDYPEMRIWKQVKQVDPSIYKLYEELVTGHEPLAKRIELLLLPIEVNVMSQMKASTRLLTDILSSEQKPWTLEEILGHRDVEKADIDGKLLLSKMAKRSLIQEVRLSQTDQRMYEKGYVITREKQ